jgi:hypothetical protein
MALRALVLALLLANLLYVAWTRLGTGADTAQASGAQREARQIRPESVRVLGPAEAAAALAAAGRTPARQAVTACVEAGPFEAGEIDAAERALAGLPAGSWQRNSVERPSAYTVFLGRFASAAEAVARRRELAERELDAEPVTEPADLAPGLAIGRYERRAEAETALAGYVARALPGIGSARVTTLPAQTEHWLRIDAPSPTLLNQVAALPSTELAGGFRPCTGS